MSKLDEKSVGNIIRIAMANNEKCRTCEFRGTCFEYGQEYPEWAEKIFEKLSKEN